MIESIITLTIIIVFIRQFYGERAEKWKARGNALRPVGRYVWADVKACVPYKGKVTDKDMREMFGP